MTAANRLSRPVAAAMRLSAVVLCLFLAAAPARAQSPEPPEPTAPIVVPRDERLYALAVLWHEAKINFAYFDHVPDLDWDQAYRDFIPLVIEEEDPYRFYRLLQRFYALLRDGHTDVWMPQQLLEGMGRAPVRFVPVEDRYILSNIGRDWSDPSLIGAELVAVDGVPVQEFVRSEIDPYLCVSTDHVRTDAGAGWLPLGPIGVEAKFTLRTPSGDSRELTLPRRHHNLRTEWAMPTTPRTPAFEWRWVGEPDERIAWVAMRSFESDEVVAGFRAALPDLLTARALIIDLRVNGGGSSYHSAAIASHLTDAPLTGSAWRTRERRAAFTAWGRWEDPAGMGADVRDYAADNAWYRGEPDIVEPAPDPAQRFLGPVVILTDHPTASAAEDFLIYLDKRPNLTKVGRPTNGSTGQPTPIELPGGGGARVCTKRDTYPDGRDFVGVGVLPDVLVPRSIEEIIAGQDRILDRGLETARSMLAAP